MRSQAWKWSNIFCYVWFLASSSAQIKDTQDEYKGLSGIIQTSKNLLNKYNRREITDRLLIFFGLVLFFSTVLYILKKRLPIFGGWKLFLRLKSPFFFLLYLVKCAICSCYPYCLFFLFVKFRTVLVLLICSGPVRPMAHMNSTLILLINKIKIMLQL